MSTNRTIDLTTLRIHQYLANHGRYGTSRDEARAVVNDLLDAIDWADIYNEDVVPAMIKAMLHAEHAHVVENEDVEIADRVIRDLCRKLSDRINERWVCRCGAVDHAANENVEVAK
jgi:polyhydroxyalkanoate synthesis regulator phasin